MEELVEYIHRNGNLNFTMLLIEIPIYKNPNQGDLIITPRILAKTKEIERFVYRQVELETENITIKTDVNPESKSISEKVFFERLEIVIGSKNVNEFQNFISDLKNDLNISAKLGRGKKLSLNLKSPNDSYNFASIQEDGEVWFYGIVNKTEEIGDKQLGIDYLNKLAGIVKASLDKSKNEWYWGVKRNGKFLNISEYMGSKKEWINQISETLEAIGEIEENQ